MSEIDPTGAAPLTRRTMLTTACAATAVAARPALGQGEQSPCNPVPRARTKGPRVFLDYDQVELDAAYDQSAYAPNREQLIKRYAANSDLTRARIGAPERMSYGPTEIERLDLYKAKHTRAPIHVFVHGGAWRLQSAKDCGFLAEPFVTAGAHLIVLDFAAVPVTGGSLTPLANQVRHAIAWIYRNAPRLGGDRNRIHLSGHSSGAHLAAVALTTDWNEFGAPDDVLKSGLCISGVFDLKPVRLSARSKYVRFDDAMEQALSPIRHLEKLTAPIVIAYGSEETPEFQRQSRDFAAAIKAIGKPVEVIRGESYNHFELLETLANPFGLTGRAALAQMRLV